jgi:serine/threonine-protein kinase
MGLVYKAEQLKPRRMVALKILPPEAAADGVFRERFIRESDMASTIEHPNIIPIYQAGEVDGILYIAMRLVEGPDLKQLIAREGRLDPWRAFGILDQVAAALDSSHAAGLVHRDVKPHNILVSGAAGAEHVYLTDFGLTKNTASKTRLTQVGHFVGTIDYVAPEQIEGKKVDARTDVYALGCVLYECLTGLLPFDRDTETAIMMAHLDEPPPAASIVRPELPFGVDNVIHKAMSKKMKERFSSCRELIAAAREELTYMAQEKKEDPKGTVVAAGVSAGQNQPDPNQGTVVSGGTPPPAQQTPPAGGTVVAPSGGNAQPQAAPQQQPQAAQQQPQPVMQQGGGWQGQQGQPPQGQQPGGPTRPGWQPPPQGQQPGGPPRPGWQPGPGGPGGPGPGGPGGRPPGGPGGPGWGGPPPGGGGSNRGMIIGIVGAVVLIAAAVVGFLLFSGGDDDTEPGSSVTTPPVTSPASPASPTESPSVPPSPTDTPTGDDGGAFPAAGDEEFVFKHIPLGIQPTCQRETADLMPKGASAGIACSPKGNKADFIAYYRFPTLPQMNRHYNGDIDFTNATRDSGSCSEGGIPSETTYTRGEKELVVGRILCFNFEGTARINWTNNKLLIYSQAGHFGGNLTGLANFWTTAGPTSLPNRE